MSSHRLERNLHGFDRLNQITKTRCDGRFNTRSIQPLHGQQFGVVAMFNELVCLAQMQHRLDNTCSVQCLADGTACTTHDGALFHRDQRIMRGCDLQQKFNI